MDDRTPLTPPPATPDPHAGTALPDAPDGARTAEGAAVVRPEQDEAVGPLEGLLGAASAEASAEAGVEDRSDEALLEQMGVEEEGIEGGQILGLVIATVVSVLALAVVLIYLFYIPRLEQVQDRASDVRGYDELEQVRTEGLAKLNQFAGSDSTGFSIPIERAMALTTAAYASPGDRTGDLPDSRAEFNTLMINFGEGNAVGTAAPERPERQRLEAMIGSASPSEVSAAQAESVSDSPTTTSAPSPDAN